MVFGVADLCFFADGCGASSAFLVCPRVVACDVLAGVVLALAALAGAGVLAGASSSGSELYTGRAIESDVLICSDCTHFQLPGSLAAMPSMAAVTFSASSLAEWPVCPIFTELLVPCAKVESETRHCIRLVTLMIMV